MDIISRARVDHNDWPIWNNAHNHYIVRGSKIFFSFSEIIIRVVSGLPDKVYMLGNNNITYNTNTDDSHSNYQDYPALTRIC